MKAITIRRFGSPSVLELRDYPEPEPSEHDVVIEVRASGLNFAEVMARKGLYPDAPKAPCVVGYEASGIVEKVGSSVTAFRPGDSVIALCHFGAHAEKVCVPEALVLAMPQGMNFEQGAALPVNYLTAHHILFQVAALRPKERVLIHMAGGGVGMAAIQLCRTIEGVELFGTASAAKRAMIREAGCDHVIDYRKIDYADEIKRLTQGQGVDVVMDALGGRDWKKGFDLLRPAGRLVAFGFANLSKQGGRHIVHVLGELMRIPRFSPMTLMDHNRSVAGVNMGHLWSHRDLLVGEMDHLFKLFTQGKIAPNIDKCFAFSEAADAHRYLEERKNIGKVLLIPDRFSKS
ncbi:MAG: zinc-binding dehydrogenase [Myxococcales bacterium]|nr:MAG: zinc-binding dehydrogenase [Myxococcales bacterium]